jgi:hypothetical protein
MSKSNRQPTWSKGTLGRINIPLEKRLELMTQLCAALITAKWEKYYHDDEGADLKTSPVFNYYGSGSHEKEQVPDVVFDAADLLVEIEHDILASIKLDQERREAVVTQTTSCCRRLCLRGRCLRIEQLPTANKE